MLKVAHSQHIATLCIQKDGEKLKNKGRPLIRAYFIPRNMCQEKFVRNLTLFKDFFTVSDEKCSRARECVIHELILSSNKTT